MYHIGHKIEVPPRSNVKAWSLLYDFLTEPGSSNVGELDAERNRENIHYVQCKVRIDKIEGGCDRCAEVRKRMPDKGKIGRRWNDIVY